MQENYRRAPNPENAHQIVAALIQSHETVNDWGAVVPLGQASLAGGETNTWTRHVLAGVYHRAGRYREALRELDESDRVGAKDNPLNDMMRSIVLARLGRGDEARAVFAKVSRRIGGPLKDGPYGEAVTHWRDGGLNPRVTQWWDWYRLQDYRREAIRLMLDADFPADPFAP